MEASHIGSGKWMKMALVLFYDVLWQFDFGGSCHKIRSLDSFRFVEGLGP